MASAFTSSDEIDVEEVPKLGWEEQVEEALQMADSKLTQEYFRAKEVVPSLVRNETRIQDFLSVENNDPVKAAERLARHWKTRKLLFGDRWLYVGMCSWAIGMVNIELLLTIYIRLLIVFG